MSGKEKNHGLTAVPDHFFDIGRRDQGIQSWDGGIQTLRWEVDSALDDPSLLLVRQDSICIRGFVQRALPQNHFVSSQ